jgi:hypothetical protein
MYAASHNPAIETKKLVHFAMGVFCKAWIHSWRGDSKEPAIQLGPYRESVRLFLRAEAPFPEHMRLVLGIQPREKALISFTVPYRSLARDWHAFTFVASSSRGGGPCWKKSVL